MATAHVNLWELITHCANQTDGRHQQECRAIQQETNGSAFCNMQELSLDVGDGAWVVKIHSPGEDPNFVELRVTRDGRITVVRQIDRADITDKREVRF